MSRSFGRGVKPHGSHGMTRKSGLLSRLVVFRGLSTGAGYINGSGRSFPVSGGIVNIWTGQSAMPLEFIRCEDCGSVFERGTVHACPVDWLPAPDDIGEGRVESLGAMGV